MKTASCPYCHASGLERVNPNDRWPLRSYRTKAPHSCEATPAPLRDAVAVPTAPQRPVPATGIAGTLSALQEQINAAIIAASAQEASPELGELTAKVDALARQTERNGLAAETIAAETTRASDRAIDASDAANAAHRIATSARDEVTNAIAAVVTAEEKIADLAKRIDAARPLVITRPSLPDVTLPRQHEGFADLLALVSAGLNTWITGPAGCGKTQAAEAVAAALGLTYRQTSISLETTEARLMGYQTITDGKYVSTPMIDTARSGGIHLGDEIDTGHPGILSVMNAVTGGNTITLPNGETIARHHSAIFIVAANTYGRGADNRYVGRNQIDAASLNRYAILDWDTDWSLAAHVSGNHDWADFCHRIADAVAALGHETVIGMRNVINGARALAAGVSRELVERTLIYNHMDAGSAAQVRSRIGA